LNIEKKYYLILPNSTFTIVIFNLSIIYKCVFEIG